ncbi:MAG: hypothetical protein ABIK09_19880 [Pseudomonadota bacterium]
MTGIRQCVCVVILLVFAACDGKKGGASPEHDMGPPGDGVSDAVPEVANPVDIIEVRPELPPETLPVDFKEAESNCHWDCFGGFTCEDGEMINYHWGPVPCWVGMDCEEAGKHWPCISGTCAPKELCTDDIAYLDALVPDDGEWNEGLLKITSDESGYDIWSCIEEICTWRLEDDVGTEVLRLRLTGIKSWGVTRLEETTTLSVVAVPALDATNISVAGIPATIEGGTLVWAPLDDFASNLNAWSLQMGRSGAFYWDDSDGIRTSIVWILDDTESFATPYRYAVAQSPAPPVCSPLQPHVFEGACVECLSSADCDDENLTCNPANHRCEPADGTCGYCEEPYPACVPINGVWSCVQCKYDEDCPDGKGCVPDLYACVGGVPPPCPGCATDDDCQSLWGDLQLECDVASGCCQDVTGLCDGVEGFCPNGECKGLWEDYLGCGVWPTSENEACEDVDPGLGLCTCSAPVDIEDPASCSPPDGCVGGSCPPQAICVDASVVELMFGASAPFDDGVCLPLEWMLNDR